MTIPINPFYAEVADIISKKFTTKLKDLLEEVPHKFYGAIDNMGKTILHCA